MEKLHSSAVNELTSLSAGLFSGSDVISLSESVENKGMYLVDGANGAKHTLSTKAKKALLILKRPCRFDEWVTYAVWTAGLRKEEITELIVFLNSIAALVIIKKPVSTLCYYYAKLMLGSHGVSGETIAFRARAHWRGLAKAITRAVMPLVLLIMLVSVLQYGANFSFDDIVRPNIFFIVTLWLTTFTHEYVHVMFARHSKNHPDILQRGLRLGILHGAITKKQQVASAILGPLVGMAVSLLFMTIVGCVIHVTHSTVLAISITIFHGMSWLPGYGDGASLKKILLEQRYA